MNVFIARSRITLILISIIPLFLIGCAATQVGLEKKDLKVQTKMSKSIFLDLDNQIEKQRVLAHKAMDKQKDSLNKQLQKAEQDAK